MSEQSSTSPIVESDRTWTDRSGHRPKAWETAPSSLLRCCAPGTHRACSCRARRGRSFSPAEIALLQTFADQAVIAIEKCGCSRSCREERALTRHTQVTEALEQQTATSEILRVIAGSPTDLQPVLDALVESAGRLCRAPDTFSCSSRRISSAWLALHGSMAKAPARRNAIRPRPGCRPGRRWTPDGSRSRTWPSAAASSRRLRRLPSDLGTELRSPCRCCRKASRSAPRLRRREVRAVLGQGDRAAPDLRRPGRHRHRELLRLVPARSRRRAASSRSPASTSPSSWPTCPTSCGRR